MNDENREYIYNLLGASYGTLNNIYADDPFNLGFIK